MDPRETLIDLLESIAARNEDDATEAMDNLFQWLSAGGFMPASIHDALDAIRFADDTSATPPPYA